MSPASSHVRADLRERGQAMVEFAMLLPVLFLVVFGLIAFGHAFGKQLDLKSATRDGARRAAVSMDRTDPVRLTRQTVYDNLTLTQDDRVTIDVTPDRPFEQPRGFARTLPIESVEVAQAQVEGRPGIQLVRRR